MKAIPVIVFCVLLLGQEVFLQPNDEVSEQILKSISQAFDESSQNNLRPSYDVDYYESKAAGVSPKVETKQGNITGISLLEAHAFYSLPYAKPPTGPLRFKQSQMADHYGDFDASTINHLACYQPYQEDCSQGLCFENLSEDCLVLNIHVPRGVDLSDSMLPPNERLPVFVWFHGGGFLNGAATSPIYDGRFLSNATNTIVVTVNYRLGALGFLVYDDGNDVINGNQGIGDQQLALKWIQENIEKFGGDKEKVTLVGNSAGAQSVVLHLMSDKSSNLFHGAVMQSLPALFKYPNMEKALEVTAHTLNITNCTNIECLRNTPPEELVKVANRIRLRSVANADLYTAVEPFSPVLDGSEFTFDPIQYFENGGWHGNEKNVILGTNIDEMAFISAYIPKLLKISYEKFEKFLMFIFGDDVGSALAQEYKKWAEANNIRDYKLVLDEVATDGFFVCSSRAMARLASATATSAKVYLYSFNHAMDDPSCEDAWNPASICGKVFHSSENSFVFRSAPLIAYNFSESDMKSVDQFSNYWGNFAYSGNPSSGDVGLGENSVTWPLYEATPKSFRQFPASLGNLVSRVGAVDPWVNVIIDSPSGNTQLDYKKDICDFWDSTGYYLTLSDNTTPAAPSNTTHVPSGNTDEPSVTTEEDKPNVAMTTQPTEEEMTTTGSAIRPQMALVAMITSLLASLMNMLI
ncbi:unnamed protein product [Clavelina lepadiformis]|uniref:Carboxylic ester hydrolase n=1 Tax=Clavelina lepadiformis TaxID=159417 RepID=A0ABP0FR49_CLALP